MLTTVIIGRQVRLARGYSGDVIHLYQRTRINTYWHLPEKTYWTNLELEQRLRFYLLLAYRRLALIPTPAPTLTQSQRVVVLCCSSRTLTQRQRTVESSAGLGVALTRTLRGPIPSPNPILTSILILILTVTLTLTLLILTLARIPMCYRSNKQGVSTACVDSGSDQEIGIG